jgi:VanZ like family/Concanavalin A-like lectin/glucanases superfamily
MRFARRSLLYNIAFMLQYRPRVAMIGWLLCWALILFAGLWPLEFHPANGVKWLQSESGISFDGNGEVYCVQSFMTMIANRANPEGQPFSLELLLRPRRQEYPRGAYILSDDKADSKPGLILLQYGSVLILHTYFRGVNNPSFSKLGVDGVLIPGQLVHVAVVSGTRGTELYINGLRTTAYDYPVAADQFTGPLVLGNSGRPDYPWTGDLLGLAVYDHQRTEPEVRQDASAWRARQPDNRSAVALYEFTEKSGEWAHSTTSRGAPLHVPRDLIILHRSMLAWDFSVSRSGLWDMAENLVAFIPFGFLAAAVFAGRWSTRTSVSFAILVGLSLSLLIEITQAYLPLRDSSSVDLAMNTLGTAAGAVSMALMSRTASQVGATNH